MPLESRTKVGASVLVLSAGLLWWRFYSHRVRTRNEQRRALEAELSESLGNVKTLERKLLALESLVDSQHDGEYVRPIRVWMDGAFDMVHYGHMNAFRKGRALGTYLVVGVNDGESIRECKGAPPIYSDEERISIVSSCKWVDEVVRHVPYVMNEEYLAHIIEKYRLDYIVHGDDPCIVDGKDVYESARKLGKYKTITRTEGISTTDIVGRMLLMTKSHHRHAPLLGDQTVNQADRMRLSSSSSNMLEFEDEIQEEHEPVARNSQFLTTLSLMRQFSQGNRPQPPDARVVYLMGSWDMFHAGHIATLRKARHYGDFVLVGIHSDATVNHTRGMNLPIQTQHERVLSVLGCKYVDDVLIDAPEIIDKDLISRLNICKVVRGEVSEVSYMPNAEESGAYVVAEEMGVLEVVPSDFTLTDAEIVARIQKQRGTMEARYERKIALEESYYKKKGLDLYNSQINT